MLPQTHLVEGFLGAAAAFGARYPTEGEGGFDVRQDRLVRDQVIALEYEADAGIAVGIPIAIAASPGRAALDFQFSCGGPVEPGVARSQGGPTRPERPPAGDTGVVADR